MKEEGLSRILARIRIIRKHLNELEQDIEEQINAESQTQS